MVLLAAPQRKTTNYLPPNNIYFGDARKLLRKIKPDAITLSFWSPPYYVGKSYEKDITFSEWKDLLAMVIRLHFDIIKPGGFLVINIADILCFPDTDMPRIQANNLSHRRCKITLGEILEAKGRYPHYSRYQLAKVLGCSEQTIDRRLKNNNIRGGKYNTQTKVKIVGGLVEGWGSSAGFYLYDRRIWVKDPAWENSRWHSLSYRSVDESEYIYIFWKPGITTIERTRLDRKEWRDWGSRGVWHIASVRSNDDHEAKFPFELARRVIRLFSAKGDLVLDPFIGSGTSAVAALSEGRQYIGFDIIRKNVELAKQKVKSLGFQ